MRWLTGRTGSDERGAVGIIVGLAMVVLMGFTAVSVDVAMMYAERTQLQNGADSAALAIAQECARDKNCTDPAWKRPVAQDMANKNANDHAANVASLTYPTAKSVRVELATKDGTTNTGFLALRFAPVLGIDTATVSAASTAAWGAPAKGPAILPLAFAPCVFKLDGAVQVISRHGDTGGVNCSSASPSGQLLPGGFGWLQDSTNTCNANVDIAVNAPMISDTGISLPANCEAVLRAYAGKTVLLPVYGDKSGSGAGGWYKITGWAAFKLLGWNFPGSAYQNGTYTGATCKGDCKGIIGQFITFASLDDRFTGAGPSLGASTITLR